MDDHYTHFRDGAAEVQRCALTCLRLQRSELRKQGAETGIQAVCLQSSPSLLPVMAPGLTCCLLLSHSQLPSCQLGHSSISLSAMAAEVTWSQGTSGGRVQSLPSLDAGSERLCSLSLPPRHPHCLSVFPIPISSWLQGYIPSGHPEGKEAGGSFISVSRGLRLWSSTVSAMIYSLSDPG